MPLNPEKTIQVLLADELATHWHDIVHDISALDLKKTLPCPRLLCGRQRFRMAQSSDWPDLNQRFQLFHSAGAWCHTPLMQQVVEARDLRALWDILHKEPRILRLKTFSEWLKLGTSQKSLSWWLNIPNIPLQPLQLVSPCTGARRWGGHFQPRKLRVEPEGC